MSQVDSPSLSGALASQATVLPAMYDHVMDVHDGLPRGGANDAPYFGELTVELEMSEPDYRLGVDNEIHAPMDALHEEIYFGTIEFFHLIGRNARGQDLTYPGRILPFMRPKDDGSAGTFGFFSYRDPRLEETFADFQRAIEWVDQGAQNSELLEQAILGVVSAIDRPGSPAGEALGAHVSALHGRTPQVRRSMRSAVLEVTSDRIRAVTEQYLVNGESSLAVVTNERAVENVTSLTLTRKKL